MATQAQIQKFVDKYRPVAIKVTQGTKIIPDTVLTVTGVESNWGLSKLAIMDNNFTGIKVGSGYKGKKSNYPTKEIINGKPVTVNAWFRSYSTPEDSFRDYVELINSSGRYKSVKDKTTPQDQFKALQDAGYSTNPSYPQIMASALNTVKKYFTPQNAIAYGGSSLGIALLIAGGLWWFRRR